MDGIGPIAGETCVVSTKAFVFCHNPQLGKWDPLGQDRSVSRVQLLKRRQGGQTLFRLLARLENGPAHAQVSLQCVFPEFSVMGRGLFFSQSSSKAWIDTVRCRRPTRHSSSCSLAMIISMDSNSARKQTQSLSLFTSIAC